MVTKFLGPEMYSVIGTKNIENLKEISDVHISYSSFLIDSKSLNQIRFRNWIITTGKLQGKYGSKILTQISSPFFSTNLASSVVSPTSCFGNITLCANNVCQEFQDSSATLPLDSTISNWTGNCSWTLYSKDLFQGDELELQKGRSGRSLKKKISFSSDNVDLEVHEVGFIEHLLDYFFLQTIKTEDQIENAVRISVKNNFLTPFTQLSLRDERITYSYNTLFSP